MIWARTGLQVRDPVRLPYHFDTRSIGRDTKMKLVFVSYASAPFNWAPDERRAPTQPCRRGERAPGRGAGPAHRRGLALARRGEPGALLRVRPRVPHRRGAPRHLQGAFQPGRAIARAL